MNNTMMDDKQMNICRRAIEELGTDKQILILFEEMAELQTALCHWKRGKATEEDVITEIADVMIMCGQYAVYFGEDRVRQEIANKTERLLQRLTKHTDL